MRSVSTISVNEGTAHPVREVESGPIHRRLLSAVVLIPPVLAGVYWGGPYFALLILLFALVMAWEWAKLSGEGRFGLGGGALMGAVAAVVVAAVAGTPVTALVAIACGAVAVHALAWREGRAARAWTALGVLYIGIPALALIWLRGDGETGRALIFWLFALVWATDFGAYGCGRLLGGPRLAPTISPRKTWAGFGGGILAAVFVSLIAAAVGDPAERWGLVLLGALLSVVAQAGDLLESAVKRHFRVKDMSQVIPGHGGVFDRVDSLLTAAPAAAGLIWVSGGGLAPWR
jgi:phosphatidate cytidylyltransferase